MRARYGAYARRVAIVAAVGAVALFWGGSMLVTWHHQPWAHRHDACGQVASSTPRLVIPVSQSRYSSGAVSSAAQAEDALVPPLRSQPQVARIAVPWSDPATLQRLTRAMATIRLRGLKATPVLLTACRE